MQALSFRPSVARAGVVRPKVSRSRISVRPMAKGEANPGEKVSKDEMFKRQQEVLEARRQNIPKDDRKESPGKGPKSMKRLLNSSPANMDVFGDKTNNKTEGEKQNPLKVAKEHDGATIVDKVTDAVENIKDKLTGHGDKA